MSTIAQLVSLTRELLKNRRASMTITEISNATGIPDHWIWNLNRGHSKNPRVDRLETLHEFLIQDRVKYEL